MCFEDAFVFGNEEIEFLIGMGNRTYLVIIIYEVPGSGLASCNQPK